MTDRVRLDDLTSDQLDALYDQLDALREVARGYCPACGRGDAAPTVTDWETERQRADQAEAEVRRLQDDIAGCRAQQWPQRLGRAEAAIGRVRAECERLHAVSVLAHGEPSTDRERGVVTAVIRVLTALDEPAPGPDTAATQTTEAVDWRQRAETAERHRDQIAHALRQALNEFRYCDHEGTRCHQTGHVPYTRISGWWDALKPPAPAHDASPTVAEAAADRAHWTTRYDA